MFAYVIGREVKNCGGVRDENLGFRNQGPGFIGLRLMIRVEDLGLFEVEARENAPREHLT